MARMFGSVIPSPYMVCHIAREVSDQLDLDTGNNIIVEHQPVIRWAQDITQIGRLRGSSKFVLTPEFAKRVDTELHIAVADPETYGPMDQVLLYPEVDVDGDYVAGTGYAFWVDGVSFNAKTSPWPNWTKIFGGMVRIRRVT
jgi:hypothetical protein